jgi:hypothetical protein
MHRIHAKISVAACAVALIAAIPRTAPADLVTFNGVALNQQVKIHSAVRTQRVKAGQLRIACQGADHLAYCVDLTQYAGSGEVTETPITTLHNGDLVGWLYETQAAAVTDSLDAVALQVAIWELLYESDDNAFDMTSGAFYVTQSDNAADAAQTLLDAAPASYAPAGTTIALLSDSKQDGMIPEPTALVLLSAGAIWAALRRRQK